MDAHRPAPDFVQQDVQEAVHNLMTHELDRRILLELVSLDDEVRWEGLRQAIGEKSKQRFQDAIERLILHVLVDHRLQPAGDRYWSWFRAARRGRRIGQALIGIARDGTIPAHTPPYISQALRGEIAAGANIDGIGAI